MDDKIYTIDVARIVDRSYQSVCNWRRDGKGPKYYQDDRGMPYYIRGEVEAWTEARDNKSDQDQGN